MSRQRFTKWERELKKACKRVVEDEFYLVGTFQKNNPHNILRICLPDYSVIRVNLPSTPLNEGAALTVLGKQIRRTIMHNLERRGLT